MGMAKSFLLLILSILLRCKILTFTPLSQKYCNNLPSVPNQFYNKAVLNLAFLEPKQQNDDVLPAIRYISTPRSVNRKMMPPPELINEKDVVALTERNFTNFIENNQRVQVIFHSSAWKVTGASLVAKVDCETLAEMYKIVR
ncbi:hypothetical protein CUMW_258460 [Citrus unshiu]|uniref:Uncharacterized protein n=1 Tax=Citrus unshiu TaxID=55188 RepID=A0A2H5QSU6_CITUN|nr:hypothetical protein CUMW_258460 [Citrus unshiu]